MIDAFIIFNVMLYLDVGQARVGPAPDSGQRSLLATRSTSGQQPCRMAVDVDVVVVDNCHPPKVWLNALSWTVTRHSVRRANNGTEAGADNDRRLRRNNSNINNNIHDPGRAYGRRVVRATCASCT